MGETNYGYCRHCGMKVLEENQSFCVNCGQNLIDGEVRLTKTKQKTNSKNLLIIRICAFVAIFMVFIGSFLTFDSAEKYGHKESMWSRLLWEEGVFMMILLAVCILCAIIARLHSAILLFGFAGAIFGMCIYDFYAIKSSLCMTYEYQDDIFIGDYVSPGPGFALIISGSLALVILSVLLLICRIKMKKVNKHSQK